jgi:hypothetical protein
MYVITDLSNNFVILGPVEWRPKYFSDIIEDEIYQRVEISKEDEQKVPYEPIPGIKIRKCNVVYEEINSKIQTHDGPYWEYYDDSESIQAKATWIAKDKSLTEVKNNLKNIAAGIRWKNEIKGVKVDIQNVNVNCDTDREFRNIYLQKYILMEEDATVNWKFSENIWLTLTKQELGYVIYEVANYIQSCYDWESEKTILIDSCNTLEELDELVFEEDKNGE